MIIFLWLYLIFLSRCYVVDCQTSTPNIPYADSFYTKTRYCITRAGSDQTRISISLGIVWLKSPFVKSIIKSTTLKTFADFCVDYMTCLRAEIAKKITPGGDASKKIEEITEEALDSSTLKELTEEVLMIMIVFYTYFCSQKKFMHPTHCLPHLEHQCLY